MISASKDPVKGHGHRLDEKNDFNLLTFKLLL